MFIAALFMIAKKWKQHRCLSWDEWINNSMLSPYNGMIFNNERE